MSSSIHFNAEMGILTPENEITSNNFRRTIVVGISVTLIVSLIALLVADRLFHPQKFQIKNIEVHGQFEQVDGSQIKQIVESALDGNYFSVSLHRLENLIKQVPWIFDASLRRQWPSTIIVDVVEVQPIARWGETKWLNLTGDLVDRQPAQTDELQLELPLINGPSSERETIWKAFQQWSEKLASNGLTLDAISLESGNLWNLKLSLGALAMSNNQSGLEYQDSPGQVSMIVDMENSYQRIQRFIDVLNQDLIIKFPEMKTIDLRYPNGFAISWTDLKPISQVLTQSEITSKVNEEVDVE